MVSPLHYYQCIKRKDGTVYIHAESNHSCFVQRPNSVIVEAHPNTSRARIIQMALSLFKQS